MENVLGSYRKEDVDVENIQSDCSVACNWLLKRIGPRKVIEIGTSYGRQLSKFVPFASHVVCVDPMYDWVPNLVESSGFDPNRVNQNKVQTWEKNAGPFRDKIDLVIGNSYLVHQEPQYSKLFSGAEVLIIDGCHQPAEMVVKDYENFKKFMTDDFYVIWDDLGMAAVQQAVETVLGEQGFVSQVDILGTRVVYMKK